MRVLGRVTVLLASSISAVEAQRVQSVCETLDHISELNGQMIAVRGEVNAINGLWVKGEACEHHIQVLGHQFADIIAVESPDIITRVHDAPFKASRKPFDTLQSALWSYHRERQVMKATFIGLIETRSDLERLIGKAGQKLGFGHMGAAPAQLLLKDVVDIVIEDRIAQRR